MVLGFVKGCFDGGAAVVEEVGAWKASWEGKLRRVVQASHAEKGDGVVRFGLVIVTVSKVALVGVF